MPQTNNRIFLGGTCAETTWREELITLLKVPSFNPVVKDWTPACQEIEEYEKLFCNIHLYVITSAMQGVFSIAEVIDSVHDNKKMTIFHIIPDGFTKGELKSLTAVKDMVLRHGGIAYIHNDLFRTATIINQSYRE